jgi:hypothetical protein
MKRRIVHKLLRELRHSVENGVPHDLTFKPTAGLSEPEKKALQEALTDSFRLYAETWLLPWLDRLEEATGVNELKRG